MTTIHDVARVAGVSISTVSYALSGKRSITESTRRRVEAAVRELDYRPNAGARMLAGRRTYIFAVTEPLRADTYEPAHMAFVLATATAARTYDYDVLLLTQDEATGGLSRVTSSRLVDGIIVLDVLREDERADLVRSLDIPSVLIGVPDDTAGLVCVDLDFEAVGRMALDRLADAGHRTVTLLGQPQAVYDRGSNFPPRLRDAFLARAAERGIDAAFHAVEREPSDMRARLATLLDADTPPTGVVFHCEEQQQTTALELLAERGVAVPGEMSIVSAAPTFPTSGFRPPLDRIPLVPAYTCGRAVELAINQIAGSVEPRVELVPPTYEDHGSVAPLPAA
ncbi:LacI family DNA-binding transcriptional regulator [Georgenia deserti]|uniref:LacI family DNA-binding transcriptional regulator n=1 Tax=Georgenia deserti TaxID=2093781 RepID=A0ABW4L8P4_9MICO